MKKSGIYLFYHKVANSNKVYYLKAHIFKVKIN